MPPQMEALYLPPFMPPAMSIDCCSVIPNSFSYTPGRFRWPDIPKSLGPGDDGVPIVLNQAGPRSMMCGTQQRVSTLFTTVGQPNAPIAAGKNGGLRRGQPR